MRLYLFSIFFLFLTFSLTAQMGIGTTSPDGSLDVVSTDDGLLIPRIALTATNVATVITPTISELVYNTATSAVGPNQVTPGYYYWDGALWIRLATGNATASWALTGNAGTNAATNFLGTTDDVDFVLRRNNIRAGFVGNPNTGSGNMNTSFGANSLLNSTGIRNVAIGTNVLPSNAAGIANVAIGERTMFSNTNGNENTAVGVGALFSNTVGNSNTAIGRNALTTNTASFNTAVGDRALEANTTGASNTSVGNNSLFLNTLGNNNTAVGVQALRANTTGNDNTALGHRSLVANTTGISNVAIGTNSLATNTTSANNTAVGFNSLNVSTAAGNSAFGTRALVATSTGANNTAVGFDAGANITTGASNIMIGASTAAPAAAGSNQLNIGNTIFGTMAGALTAGVNTTRTVGINVTSPEAALDVFSTDNGLLVPRISLLVGVNNALPLTAPVNSEIIYNTNNMVAPRGFYFWDAFAVPARWVPFATGTATGWLTTGNAGLNAATNFIGTTDGVDVAFRRSSAAAGRIAATSTSFGLNALTAGSATNATAFGVNALAANTGINNTAFGTNALAANTTSANNTAFGFNALAINTPNSDTGAQNTAIGSGALASLNGGNNNTAIGFNALTNIPGTTRFNTAVGSNSLSGINSAAAINNVAVGDNTMTGSGVITRSVAIGSNALQNVGNNSTRNTAVGAFAGSATTSGNDNVFIGNAAGSSEAGAGSNKLYIENTGADASNALIYGEFDTNILRVNGTLQVNNPASVNGYALPNVRGTVGQVLQTNGAGATSWVNSSSLSITETDPQVSSATINRIPKWNGTTLIDGIVTDDGTTMTVTGNTVTTNFQMTNGATANYVLQSNGVGNGSWVDPNVKSFVTTGVTTGIYNVSLAEYTVRVFNGVLEVRLPNAVGNLGKIFVIIGSNGITSKVFSTAGGVIYNDVGNVLINTLNQNQRFTVQSDGTDWIVIAN
ncbi:hypothetical protein WFZ85_15230 [Flavobacterium sp. j3]|uniref:Trimeric autotransporter adhesin YadA-like head domain-containing protein n=1 Tax=Flavobacterium aureirubrum TaxID=3133147 RepID=A0ABU9N8X1_9FLAO